jgi:hypothetical protein
MENSFVVSIPMKVKQCLVSRHLKHVDDVQQVPEIFSILGIYLFSNSWKMNAFLVKEVNVFI